MSTILTRYIGTLSGIMITFSSFVACGTQMYKAKMDEDIQTSSSKNAATAPGLNDKSSTGYGIHAPQGWVKLPINFKFGDGLNEQQKVELMAAMKRWEWAVGKTLWSFEGQHSGVTGDSFKDLYSSLGDNVNGHYLDENWTKTAKPDYVLATTIWNNGNDYTTISKADIRFNDQYYVIGDALEMKSTDSKEVVDMQSLALHELGHFLGLGHIDEDVDSLSIMNPTLFIGEGLTTRKLARSDIERIQQIYGCDGKACDIDNLLKEQDEANWDKLEFTAKLWNDKGSHLSPPLELN